MQTSELHDAFLATGYGVQCRLKSMQTTPLCSHMPGQSFGLSGGNKIMDHPVSDRIYIDRAAGTHIYRYHTSTIDHSVVTHGY